MGAVKYLLSLEGRTGIYGMWLMTAAFVALALLSNQLEKQGVNTSSILVIQMLLIWPTFIAVPTKRFHDMGRPFWWVLIFLGGMLTCFLFLILDLTMIAGDLGLSAFSALTDSETYLAALREQAGVGPTDAVKWASSSGLGFGALWLTLALVEFGWLHFVPGNRQSNDYGPQRNAVGSR